MRHTETKKPEIIFRVNDNESCLFFPEKILMGVRIQFRASCFQWERLWGSLLCGRLQKKTKEGTWVVWVIYFTLIYFTLIAGGGVRSITGNSTSFGLLVETLRLFRLNLFRKIHHFQVTVWSVRIEWEGQVKVTADGWHAQKVLITTLSFLLDPIVDKTTSPFRFYHHWRHYLHSSTYQQIFGVYLELCQVLFEGPKV